MVIKENDLPCCLLMPSGQHDPRRPTRGARQTPQRREVVMVDEAEGEAEDEVVAEGVAMDAMQTKMTIKKIKSK